jgi:hypothetical protein
VCYVRQNRTLKPGSGKPVFKGRVGLFSDSHVEGEFLQEVAIRDRTEATHVLDC